MNKSIKLCMMWKKSKHQRFIEKMSKKQEYVIEFNYLGTIELSKTK